MAGYFFMSVSADASTDEKTADDFLKKFKLALNAHPMAKEVFAMRSVSGVKKKGIVVEVFPGTLCYEDANVDQIPTILEGLASMPKDTKFEEKALIQVLIDNLDTTIPRICGECCPCRLGGPKIHRILKAMHANPSEKTIRKELYDTAFAMQQASKCVVGMFGADAVLFACKNFWMQEGA